MNEKFVNASVKLPLEMSLALKARAARATPKRTFQAEVAKTLQKDLLIAENLHVKDTQEYLFAPAISRMQASLLISKAFDRLEAEGFLNKDRFVGLKTEGAYPEPCSTWLNENGFLWNLVLELDAELKTPDEYSYIY
jgi:hypothetical protein